MTAASDTFSIPFELTDDDRREVCRRWLRKQVRMLPFVAILTAAGIALPGKLGGVLLGMALYLVAVTASMYRLALKNLRHTCGGALAERRLVLAEGRVAIHSAASVSWLNGLTVKKIVEGDRLAYFEAPWGQWQVIPRSVLHQHGIRDRVVAASGRTTTVPVNIDRWQ